MSLRSKMPPTSNSIPPCKVAQNRQNVNCLAVSTVDPHPLAPLARLWMPAPTSPLRFAAASRPQRSLPTRTSQKRATPSLSLNHITPQHPEEQPIQLHLNNFAQPTASLHPRLQLADGFLWHIHFFIFGCSLVVSWSVSVRTATHNPPNRPELCERRRAAATWPCSRSGLH
jgi:hypothetical protein